MNLYTGNMILLAQIRDDLDSWILSIESQVQDQNYHHWLNFQIQLVSINLLQIKE